MSDKPAGYTKLKQWEKQEAAFWKAMGYTDPKLVNPVAGLINLRCSEATDQHIVFMVNRITHVDELDLKEALVTNDGIKQLTALKKIGKLYLKDCPNLDNGCVPYLNQLTTLEHLSVASTEIDIAGVVRLDKLTALKSLAFSTPETGMLYEQVEVLAAQHPGCIFYINGKRRDVKRD